MMTGCVYCKSLDECPEDKYICPDCCVAQAKEQNVTLGCCG